MTTMGTVNVNAGKLLGKTTVKVRMTGVKKMKFRMRCAIPIMKLACIIAGFGGVEMVDK